MNQNRFSQTFTVVFVIIFIYLIMGVYFKHEIGVWFSTIWYIMGLAGFVFFFYIGYRRSQRKQEKQKVINAMVIRK